MKVSHLLPAILAVTQASATVEVEEVYNDNDLVARAEMTYFQNWCLAGGTAVGSIGLLGSAAAAWMTYLNGQKTCHVHTTVVKEYRRMETPSEKMLLAQHLEGYGYRSIDRSDFWEGEDVHGLDTISFSDGITDLIIGNSTIPGAKIATIATRQSSEKRDEHAADAEVNRARLHYKVTKEQSQPSCHSAAQSNNFKNLMESVLNRASKKKCKNSCFNFHDNLQASWTGYMKIDEALVGKKGYHSTSKKCYGYF